MRRPVEQDSFRALKPSEPAIAFSPWMLRDAAPRSHQPDRAVPADPIAVCASNCKAAVVLHGHSRTILKNGHGDVIWSAGVAGCLNQELTLPVGRAMPQHDVAKGKIRNDIV
jgi:hypothetical protein